MLDRGPGVKPREERWQCGGNGTSWGNRSRQRCPEKALRSWRNCKRREAEGGTEMKSNKSDSCWLDIENSIPAARQPHLSRSSATTLAIGVQEEQNG
jgi:hypothetical protein